MSKYLARLKQLEHEKNVYTVGDSLPSKPSKVPFEPFEGTQSGDIAKNNEGETAPATISKPLSRQALHSEAQRQKVIAMLNADPNLERAILTDTDSDPHFVILSIAVRSCNQTCEMQIDKATYDPWALLELIEKCGTTTH
jgi:hypothetical protein